MNGYVYNSGFTSKSVFIFLLAAITFITCNIELND